ncbi:hypothetical protein [Actinocorallia longicatena]|uniref:Uncharacterized protein n=1 Tax=Actinocorallia longicatena TaxID=111803 RepID=A0ABP6PZY0_9ACTN
MGGFGSRQLTLALMHRMRDLNAGRVEDALREMDASRAEIRAAHTMWTRWAHSRTAPKGVRAFRAALGPPLSTSVRDFGDLPCEVATWKLVHWPDFEFELLLGPDGRLWNQWFVRAGEPKAIAFADLAPWTAVVSDVGASFEGAEHVEGSAPHHWAVDFTHEGEAHRALFVYGLLQRVDRR